jgi:Bromodomain
LSALTWSLSSDRLLSRLFQELPDRKLYNDYYLVIHNPIALDNIQVSSPSSAVVANGQATLKQGGYAEFPAFIRDIAQVFWNARFYNNSSSQVFHDAATLEVHRNFRALRTPH